jgi:membrane protease YdiL (CAAX protease family)
MQEDRKSTGITNWIYFGLAIITVMVFLLGNVGECESTQFCATTIFFIVFIGSLIMLVILWLIYPSRLANGNVKLFFMQDVTFKKLTLVIPGVLSVIAVSYLATLFNNGSPDILQNPAPFIGIFLSGLIMGLQLIMTHSILIPILTHGIYNSIVVLLREQIGGLATFPISVPEIGISIKGFSDLGSEIIFQNVLVASSEELFKTFIIAFFIVATTGAFTSKGKSKWIGMLVAVTLWTLYHSIAK